MYVDYTKIGINCFEEFKTQYFKCYFKCTRSTGVFENKTFHTTFAEITSSTD